MKSSSPRIAGNKFLSGALILSAGGLLAKVIGAVYRIPLTNILGARGMGIYQIVFPMYALLLTVGSSGLNIAVSRLVAEKLVKNDRAGIKAVFSSALKTLGILGLAGTVLLLLFGGTIARVQGEAAAAAGYTAIAPAVILVCFISAFRGFFQGKQKMLPTAASQVVEQLVKMILSLLAAVYFMPDAVAAAAGALWAVTFSEAAALLLLVIVYVVDKKRGAAKMAAVAAAYSAEIGAISAPAAPQSQPIVRTNAPAMSASKQLFLLAVPITLSGIILPLTQLIDSALVLNLLGRYTTNATALFGLLSGPVNSLIALPTAVTLGFATAAVPAVSRLRSEGNIAGMKKKSAEAIKLTLLCALASAVVLCIFSRQIIGLLYRGLTAEEKAIASRLLQIGSISVVFLSLLSTLTSVLQGVGRIYAPVRNLAIAAAIKILLNLLLLSRPEINIYGAAASTAACYMLAAALDFMSLQKYFRRDIIKCETQISTDHK